uniref:Uncharacterized protein n=1 Tax=viral metagenome TaxID=1070528 RepID=A0A6C0LFX1_9ZZZZ
MEENLNLLTKCYITNCNKESKKRNKIRDIWLNNSNKLYLDYINKIITKKQYDLKLTKLDNEYHNSIEKINLHKCEIDKCYNLVKNHLNYLSDKNKITKKNNYNIDDYLKILNINRQNIIKPI